MTPDEIRSMVYRETCEGCKEGAPIKDGEHVYIPKDAGRIFPDTKDCTRNTSLAEKVVELVKEARNGNA